MRTLVTVMATLAGTTLLGSCSGEPTAEPPIPIVRPTAVTPSATSNTPGTAGTAGTADAARAAIPKNARPHTFPAAQAFAEFYYAQLNKAWTTPDPEAIRPYGLETCKTCRNFEVFATSMVTNGSRYDRNPVAVQGAAYLPESTPTLAQVSVLTTQLAAKVVRRDGTIADVVPQERGESVVDLTWVERSGWRIHKIHSVKKVQ